MRILLSGATGFLGTALSQAFERDGHTVVRLVRPQGGTPAAQGQQGQTIRWDPGTGQLEAAAAEGADALVHLAGASIAGGRWSRARKNLLRTSRIDATRQLIGALSRLQRPPRVIVAASAIGYYGDRGDETLSETSPPGHGFLATLCQEWEAQAALGKEFGARVVMLRFGIVLAAHGGALPPILLPFKLGIGGRLSSGRQWMSWITLRDAVEIVRFALANAALSGPVNTVAQTPVTNQEFTKILARALHRPAFLPAPAFALRFALGEMADALLLTSQRVVPAKLQQAGYRFVHTDLASALQEVLRKTA